CRILLDARAADIAVALPVLRGYHAGFLPGGFIARYGDLHDKRSAVSGRAVVLFQMSIWHSLCGRPWMARVQRRLLAVSRNKHLSDRLRMVRIRSERPRLHT